MSAGGALRDSSERTKDERPYDRQSDLSRASVWTLSWTDVSNPPARTSRRLPNVSSSTIASLLSRAKASMASATFFLPSNLLSDRSVRRSLRTDQKSESVKHCYPDRPGQT